METQGFLEAEGLVFVFAYESGAIAALRRCGNRAYHSRIQSSASVNDSIGVRPLEEAPSRSDLPVRERFAGPTSASLFHGRCPLGLAIQPAMGTGGSRAESVPAFARGR